MQAEILKRYCPSQAKFLKKVPSYCIALSTAGENIHQPNFEVYIDLKV